MEGTRRLTPQGHERRQQLLDSAAALFAERGFAETRVIDVVRAAGVAKGLFYWYFENKESLFEELVESTHHRLRRAQAAAVDGSVDPLVRLHQGCTATVRFIASHPDVYTAIRAEGLAPHAAAVVRRGTDLHVRDTARLLREAAQLGLVRDEDPTLLAYGVIGIVSNFTYFHRTGRIDGPVDELAELVGRMVVRAVAADDEVAARTQRMSVAAPGATAGLD